MCSVYAKTTGSPYTWRTVFPRFNAAATNFFPSAELAATIRGRRLLEGGD